jgi:small-conductance mechanosensitive channel
MFRRRPHRSAHHPIEEIMNSIIYIVGLVVVILFFLSFFGLR